MNLIGPYETGVGSQTHMGYQEPHKPVGRLTDTPLNSRNRDCSVLLQRAEAVLTCAVRTPFA